MDHGVCLGAPGFADGVLLGLAVRAQVWRGGRDSMVNKAAGGSEHAIGQEAVDLANQAIAVLEKGSDPVVIIQAMELIVSSFAAQAPLKTDAYRIADRMLVHIKDLINQNHAPLSKTLM